MNLMRCSRLTFPSYPDWYRALVLEVREANGAFKIKYDDANFMNGFWFPADTKFVRREGRVELEAASTEDGEVKLDNEKHAVAEFHDDTNTMMIASSIGMSLSLMKTVGLEHTSLFTEISNNILKIIVSQKSATSLSSIEKGKASCLGQVLDDLESFLKTVVDPTLKSQAVQMLSALAMARGSVADLLEVVGMLSPAEGSSGWGGLPSAEILDRLAMKGPDTRLTLIRSIHDGARGEPLLEGNVTMKMKEGFKELSSPTVRMCSSNDGAFVYVYHHDAKELVKVGTGSNQTIAGKVYATTDSLTPSTAAARLEEKVSEGDAFSKVRVVLYFCVVNHR